MENPTPGFGMSLQDKFKFKFKFTSEINVKVKCSVSLALNVVAITGIASHAVKLRVLPAAVCSRLQNNTSKAQAKSTGIKSYITRLTFVVSS